MDKKDYYKILKVSKDADLNTIKKSYKKLAIKWHPDKNIYNKEEAEIRFKEISEAYQILSDKDKRYEYDNMKNYESTFTNTPFMNPFDLINNFFEFNNIHRQRHFGFNPFTDMERQFKKMEENMNNMNNLMSHNHESYNYSNINGNISKTKFYPLHIMDHSIINGSCNIREVTKALTIATEIKKRIKYYGGTLSILWHNSTMNSVTERQALYNILKLS